jgi:hypothetical protein
MWVFPASVRPVKPYEKWSFLLWSGSGMGLLSSEIHKNCHFMSYDTTQCNLSSRVKGMTMILC